MKILYAELETRHFTFRCVAVTKSNSIDVPAKHDIETTLHRGLRWHCEQVGVNPDKLLKYVASGEYNIHVLEPGVLYRDSWPLGPSGTNTVAPGKEGRGECDSELPTDTPYNDSGKTPSLRAVDGP